MKTPSLTPKNDAFLILFGEELLKLGYSICFTQQMGFEWISAHPVHLTEEPTASSAGPSAEPSSESSKGPSSRPSAERLLSIQRLPLASEAFHRQLSDLLDLLEKQPRLEVIIPVEEKREKEELEKTLKETGLMQVKVHHLSSLEQKHLGSLMGKDCCSWLSLKRLQVLKNLPRKKSGKEGDEMSFPL